MFEIGDLLEIKSWSEMEKEFGLDVLGSIDCKFAFLPEMKHLCGKRFVLYDIVFDAYLKEYELISDSDYDENHELSGWSISRDMVKLVGRGERQHERTENK